MHFIPHSTAQYWNRTSLRAKTRWAVHINGFRVLPCVRNKFALFARLGLAAFIGLAVMRLAARAAEAPVAKVEGAPDGSVTLDAKDAKIEGPNARYEESEKSVAWWTNVDTSLKWIAKIPRPGKYRVELNFAVFGNANHGELSITAGDQTTEAVINSSNGIINFEWGQAGEITINRAGELPVTVAPREKRHEFVIYLRSIMLLPSDAPGHAVDVTGSPIQAADDGTFKLRAANAEIVGMNAVVEDYTPKNIGYWDSLDTSVRWQIVMRKPGKYRVEMNYSLTPSANGCKVAVLVGDQSVTARPKAGANWLDYKVGSIGEVTITGTGYFPVEVKPVSKPGDFLINLRSVTLAPAQLPTAAIDIADQPARQAGDGSIKLTVNDAEIDGQVAKLEGGDSKYVVWWGSRNSGITWPVVVDKPGRFNVMVSYSLAETGSSSDVTFTAGGQSITGQFPPTRGWDNFRTVKVGVLDIPDKGDLQVVMKSSMEPGLHIMNLRAVKLVAPDK